MARGRLKIILILFLIAGAAVFLKLFYLQILKFSFYRHQAELRRSIERETEAERGKIYDRNGYLLADNIATHTLIVVPANIQNVDETAWALAPFLNIYENTSEFNNLKKRLSYKADFYHILKKNLSDEEARSIKELNIAGVLVERGTKRYYPESKLFSHVLGFIGVKNDQLVGQYGIEEFLEKDLIGKTGIVRGEKTPSGTLILDSEKIVKQPENGNEVIITIDRSIQYHVCSELAHGVRVSQAESGTAIIMDPKTGKILAMCNYPNFDPNNYQEIKDYSIFFNSVVSESFEPGSVFKVITMAAALDSGQVVPETIYEDTGEVKLAGYTIKNSDLKAHGIQSMTNVLEKSLNTGAIFVARKVGLELFRTYVKNFGFASLTGLEQPGEAIGDTSNLNKSGEIYLATASFGQGLAVTPIQLLAAIGSIANQGKLMRPYLVDKVIKSNGSELINEPKFIRQVISPSTATTLTAMMVSVLENGYGKLARVANYWVAGKTGTAQVPNPRGGYSDKTIHSFVGFVPHDNPTIVGVIKINNPKIGRFAESTAAPVFGKIASYVLKYYNIEPNRPDKTID